MAAEDVLEGREEAALIRRFADAAESASNHRQTLGAESRNEFERRVGEAGSLAAEIKDELISRLSQDDKGIKKNLAAVRQYGREVAEEASRIGQAAVAGRIQEIQSSIATIGENLLHRAVFPLHHLQPDLHSRFVAAARTLHLLELRRLGGPRLESLEEIQDEMEQAAAELIEIADAAERALDTEPVAIS